MERRNFFGNLIGLIGIISNAGNISKIGVVPSKLTTLVILPESVRNGDLVVSNIGKMYVFTGNALQSIHSHDAEKLDVVLSGNPSCNYRVFSSAYNER